jgi:hypothetical protein
MNIATYHSRPNQQRDWHRDARIYQLNPAILGHTTDGRSVAIEHIIVTGIREWTPMTFDGQPVYKLHTVVYTIDESVALWQGWLEGQINHETALAQLGYRTEGHP